MHKDADINDDVHTYLSKQLLEKKADKLALETGMSWPKALETVTAHKAAEDRMNDEITKLARQHSEETGMSYSEAYQIVEAEWQRQTMLAKLDRVFNASVF